MPLLHIITMEKQCSSLGSHSHHSVSFVTIPVVVMELSRNSNCSPTLPRSPLTIPDQCMLRSLQSSGGTRTIAASHAGHTTTCSPVWLQWLGKNDLFPSVSFLQAFLSPWARPCEHWWDKQKLYVIINHWGVAHTELHSYHTWVSASVIVKGAKFHPPSCWESD